MEWANVIRNTPRAPGVWPPLFSNTLLSLAWKSRSSLFLYLEAEWLTSGEYLPRSLESSVELVCFQWALNLSGTIDKLGQSQAGEFVLVCARLFLKDDFVLS